MSKGFRIFNIMQYEVNPITGEDLHFNETNIISALSHKTFREWAYTYHDKDKYTLADETTDRERLSHEFDELSKRKPKTMAKIGKEKYIEKNLVKRAGTMKPLHWHITVRCDNAIEISDVAKWFGVSENFVDVPKGYRGRDGFIDCIRYQTHEDEKQIALGKYRYPDEQIKSNFDWREAIANFIARITKNGKVLDDREYVAHEVCYNGMTLRTVREKYPDVWVKDITILKKLRGDYLENLPVVTSRVNYYVCGKGRSGKGLLSRAIARTMFPGMTDDEIFFETGASNVTFEGYDGQPVIIWNDCRSQDLIKKLGNRENVFNTFDTHPTKGKQNIKYGSISLVNVVNIVNSVQSYNDFLDGLAGEYISHGEVFHAEDKRQSYERFPVILPIHAEDFEVLFNRGYFYDWDDFTQYRVEARIKSSLPKIARACDGNTDLQRQLEARVLSPIVEKLQYSQLPKSDSEAVDPEKMFEELGYGTLLDTGTDETEKDAFKKSILNAFEKFQSFYCNVLEKRPEAQTNFKDQWNAFSNGISRYKYSAYLADDIFLPYTFRTFLEEYCDTFGTKFLDDAYTIFNEVKDEYLSNHTVE